MAHHMEAMDVDMTEDKENSFIQNNAQTEKGYEELDAPEINMRLRYSLTPVSTPMSKSYTIQCPEKTNNENNPNMTRSLNAAITRDPQKSLPLQVLNDSTEDPNRTAAVLRSIESVISDGADVTVTVMNASDDSFPSSASSADHTPEATTPTKEIPKPQGSPIMRGLKSVFNIFRTSQSPIPPDENDPNDNVLNTVPTTSDNTQTVIASTPLVTNKRDKEKRSPKESIAFKDDLEKQLQWNDDDIIFTKKEKIPIHKLFFNAPQPITDQTLPTDVSMAEEKNVTVEAMEVSYNVSILKAQPENSANVLEHDATAASEKDESVFLDCESSLNETQLLDGSLPVNATVNVTHGLDIPAHVSTTLNDTKDTTNLSMKSAETMPDINKTAIEDTHETVNASIVSVENLTHNMEINAEISKTITSGSTKENKIKETTDSELKTQEVLVDANVTTVKEKLELNVANEKLAVDNKDNKMLLKEDENLQSHKTEVPTKSDTKPAINEEINYEEKSSDNQIEPETTKTTLEISERFEPATKIDIDKPIEQSKRNSDAAPADNISTTIHEKHQNEESTELVHEVNLTIEEVKNTENEGKLSSFNEAVDVVTIDTNNINTVQENQSKDICKPEILNEKVPENKVVTEINVALKEDSLKADIKKETEMNKTLENIQKFNEQFTEGEIEKQDTDAEVAIEPAMVFSSIDITDDAVIISTPNNKSIQVKTTTEDISMMEADFLVPPDEIDSDEIKPNDLEARKHAVEGSVEEISKILKVTETEIVNEKHNIESIILNSKVNEEMKHIVSETQTQLSQETKDEEIIVSESSSPYVSLKPENDNELISDSTTNEIIDNPCTSRATLNSSPPITSRGYNFNFDEMDDPFDTKKKVRLSNPSDVNTTEDFNKSFEPIEKISKYSPRKSLGKPKPKIITKGESPIITATKNKIEEKETSASKDSSFDHEEEIPPNVNDTIINNELETSTADASKPQESKKSQTKDTSSSEQSTYFSLESSTGELVKPQITLPVFDEDSILNPFATKSKIRFSPPPSETVVEAINKALSQDNIEATAANKKKPINDVTQNISQASGSSNATDENNETVREINTEDEDTVEGPFIEAALSDHTDKLEDVVSEKVNIDDFKELPPQVGVENTDSGEMFIDAEAFEFLMNQNQSTEVADSGKESLFLKFDPLFTKRINSDGVLDVLAKIQKRQSTPKKMAAPPAFNESQQNSMAGPSHATPDIAEEIEDYMMMPNKPTMVVPPAVNQISKHRPTTPTRLQRRSMTFTSPAMAVIDRLLSLSFNNTPSGIDNTVLINAEREEADRALTELRELLAEKELDVHNLRCETNELRDRLALLDSQVMSLKAEGEKRLRNIDELQQKLAEKNKLNKSMESVVEEYERTIAGLIAETEADKRRHAAERMQLTNERDEQTAHLASMEVAFSDLHSKYEKSKQIIYAYKAKEDKYRKSVQEFEENLLKMQNNYDSLKQHATANLNHANGELEKINKAHEAEVLKLNAMIKRKDLHITSLEETLAQKIKANADLSAICDELINKV